jgi:hypothetical protein
MAPSNLRQIRRLLLIVVAVGVLGIPAAAATTTQHSRVAVATRHCGSFKYGTDGLQPGPGGITAKGVTCWFARAVALLGPAPGWHCTNTVGLLFVCQRGDAVVRFYGE